MRTRRSVLGLFSGLALASPGADATASRSHGGVPPVLLGLLARGFNLPGWLDNPEQARTGAPDPSALRLLRELGFTHVRLPVRPERLSRRFSTPAEVGRALDEVRRAIDALFAAGYGVMLDLHPGERFDALLRLDPGAGAAAVVEAWSRLARPLAVLPPMRLCFELLNEPPLPADLWAAQVPVLADAIRAEAPNHTLIVGPAAFQRVEALAAMTPLARPNVAYAVHFYDPMAFTHQGIDWAASDPLSHLANVPFPSRPGDPRIAKLRAALDDAGRPETARVLAQAYAAPWTAERISAALAPAAEWSRRHDRPVLVNEFGVLRHRAPPQDRIAWLWAVRTAAEEAGFGWTHWDYADGFGLATRSASGDIPDPATIEALLAPAAPVDRLRHRR